MVRQPVRRMNARLLTLAAALLACLAGIACDEKKPSPAETTGAQPAAQTGATTTAAPAATAKTTATAVTPPASCPNCEDAKGPATFAFSGKYRDPACTEPVAHADVPACATVNVSSLGPIRVQEEPVRKGTQPMRSVVRQLNPDEAAKLFEKRDGACVAYEPRGYKLTPLGCDGKKVCRSGPGDLACSNCRMLDNGCADNVASRTYVLLSAK